VSTTSSLKKELQTTRHFLIEIKSGVGEKMHLMSCCKCLHSRIQSWEHIVRKVALFDFVTVSALCQHYALSFSNQRFDSEVVGGEDNGMRAFQIQLNITIHTRISAKSAKHAFH
jgi:hypothetical protein